MIKKLLLISVVVGCLSVFLCTPAFAVDDIEISSAYVYQFSGSTAYNSEYGLILDIDITNEVSSSGVRIFDYCNMLDSIIASRIVFNDVVYTDFAISEDGSLIGNLSMVNAVMGTSYEDNGLPFCIMNYQTDYPVVATTEETDFSVVVECSTDYLLHNGHLLSSGTVLFDYVGFTERGCFAYFVSNGNVLEEFNSFDMTDYTNSTSVVVVESDGKLYYATLRDPYIINADTEFQQYYLYSGSNVSADDLEEFPEFYPWSVIFGYKDEGLQNLNTYQIRMPGSSDIEKDVSVYLYNISLAEDVPTEGGSTGTLESITVFFSADWLSYDSGIVSVGLEDLDPTKTYAATVYLYEKGGSASDPLRTSTLTDITGETYNNALVFTGLDVNTEYETSIVVSCGEDTVGEATASFKTPDYDYAINVLSTNVQYNTFSCEIEVTGLPEYEIDNPDCWVYVSATLNDGTSEPDEWLNSNTNLNGNKARIYFSQTQLDPETEYTLTLEIFRTADDWTKGESTGVTETVTFTTEAAYVADEEEDSEDTSTKDEAAEKFEEWDTVTDIPEDVTDKTNEGDKLLNDMDTLEKPEPDELVPDLSVDLVPVSGFFDAIFGYGLIVEMMTMAAGFALVATVLFGKRG